MTTHRKPTQASVSGLSVTLQQAHDALRRQLPDHGAPASEWLAYYSEAEHTYRSVADVDTDHHFEALHFAAMAKEDADTYATANATANATAEATSARQSD